MNELILGQNKNDWLSESRKLIENSRGKSPYYKSTLVVKARMLEHAEFFGVKIENWTAKEFWASVLIYDKKERTKPLKTKTVRKQIDKMKEVLKEFNNNLVFDEHADFSGTHI